MAFYLSTDGVDDYIITPSLTFTEVLIDFTPHQASRNQYYVDMRNASFTSPYVLHTSTNDQWAGCTVYVDGVQKTTGSIQIPNNTRHVLRIVPSGAPVTRTVNFCRRWTGTEFLGADFYSITFKNGETTVAQYDMSTQTVNDQSGNGNHATLTGGTFVDDGAGGTPITINAVTATATADSLAPTVTTQQQISVLSVVATANADAISSSISTATTISAVLATVTADSISPAISTSANIGSVVGTATAEGITPSVGSFTNVAVNAAIAGVNADMPAPTIRTDAVISAIVADLQAAGIAPSLNASVIIGTVALSGKRELYVYLTGKRELNVNLKGGL